MLQSTANNVHPKNSCFQNRYDNEVSRTQTRPLPFAVFYHRAGSGRDAFIQDGDGGQFKKYAPAHVDSIGTFSQRKPANPPPAPVLKARTTHYQSDGTGRDSYVC